MYHFLTLKQKIQPNKSQKDLKQIEISLQGKQYLIDDQKKQFQINIAKEIEYDELCITIGSKIQTSEEIENKMGVELILFRLFQTLEFFKEYSIIKQIVKLKININHSTAQVISPIFALIDHFQNLTKLEIVSVQSLNEKQKEQFYYLITEKLLYLQSLVFNIASEKNKGEIIKIQQNQKKQEKLQEITLLISHQIEDIEMLQLFPNLKTLKLLFHISSNNNFIQSALKKISALVPQIISLEVVILSTLSCNLSPICNLQNLQSIKLELKNEIDLDLSQLKNLKDINLQLPDPLKFFCKQKNIPNLEKLSFCNTEVIQQKSKEDNASLIQHYQKIISGQKNLTSLIISNQGCKSKAFHLLKRDLEVISVLIKQLSALEITLIPLENLKSQEIDEELVNILCKILDCCKHKIKINLNFNTTLMSIESKCDLGLSIGRLEFNQLCFLNGESFKQFFWNYAESIILNNDQQSKQEADESLFLLNLGAFGNCMEFTSKILKLQTFQLKVLTSCLKENSKSLNNKIKEVFKPFKRINFRDEFAVSQYFPEDLISLHLEQQISEKVINKAIQNFPQLLLIEGWNHDMQQILPSSKSKSLFPMRSIELKLRCFFLTLNTQFEIFQFNDHFFRIAVFLPSALTYSESIQMIKYLADQNNRFLFFQEPKNRSSNIKHISNYSFSVIQEILFAKTYYKILANILTINPAMVLVDLYF